MLLCVFLVFLLPLKGSARFIQDEFVVSMWVDPVVHPSEFDARYREMAQANITVLLGGFGATTPDSVGLQLAACETNGLKAIVSTCGGTSTSPTPGACVTNTTIASSPALLGYQMKDEPDASEFPSLKNWSDTVSKQGKKDGLRFINLLPNYAVASQLNASSYSAYVQEFMETVDPDVLCMDHYPFFEGAYANATLNTSMEGYHRNMEVLRKYSVLHNVPFWNFFNAIPFGYHLAANKGQIAWQAFTSLAYGAKGVLYFTYWSPGFPTPGATSGIDATNDATDGAKPYHRSMNLFKNELGTFDKGGGLISPITYGIDGSKSEYIFQPTIQYQYAKEINTLLVNYGNYLLPFTSTNVWRPHLQPIPPLASPIATINETNSGGSSGIPGLLPVGKYLIGYFKGPATTQNRQAIVIMNQRSDINVWPTITFRENVSIQNVRELDAHSGQVRPVRDDSPGIPGLQLVLEAGHARVLVIG
jgi:hypothetical protein